MTYCRRINQGVFIDQQPSTSLTKNFENSFVTLKNCKANECKELINNFKIDNTTNKFIDLKLQGLISRKILHDEVVSHLSFAKVVMRELRTVS